ncbi:hypothetical protein PO124_11145 [Bacillus licheniformis]|nr:hypothetical protein [Bacillus licheniformis]
MGLSERGHEQCISRRRAHRPKVAFAIEAYLYRLQDAINTNDFGLVRDSLKEGSPLYNDQRNWSLNCTTAGQRRKSSNSA